MRPLLIQVREVGGGGRNGSFPRSLTKLSGKCPLLEGCGQVREEAPAERLCRCCQAVAGSEPMFSCSWLKRLKIERHVLLKRKGFIQAVRVSGSWRPSFPRLILKSGSEKKSFNGSFRESVACWQTCWWGQGGCMLQDCLENGMSFSVISRGFQAKFQNPRKVWLEGNMEGRGFTS